jgi:predicted NAD/FAD-dependent oxidoreductase
LLIHGKLHNNVRMTWGKALLPWSKSAVQTMRRLIELNHRYALDGSDACSYGGLLWCLGLFAEPARESIPVYGHIKPRPAAIHAQRLDASAYHLLTTQPATGQRKKIAVVGGGLAGAMAARILQDHGHEVVVFDKGKRSGGRMSSRIVDDDHSFDHGAQFFTARDPLFIKAVQQWRAKKAVRVWPGPFGTMRGGHLQAVEDNEQRFVATPLMSSLVTHVLADLPVQFEVKIDRVTFADNGVQLYSSERQSRCDADAIVIALPSPQAAALLPPGVLRDHVAAVQMQPCLALMVSFSQRIPCDFSGIYLRSQSLSWVARMAGKPGRGSQENWVIHATPEFSTQHWTDPAPEQSERMLAAFCAALAMPPTPVISAQIHRWPYAQCAQPLTVGCLFDGQKQLAVCGDWCAGSRVEGAYLSGVAAAGRLLGHWALLP